MPFGCAEARVAYAHEPSRILPLGGTEQERPRSAALKARTDPVCFAVGHGVHPSHLHSHRSSLEHSLPHALEVDLAVALAWFRLSVAVGVAQALRPTFSKSSVHAAGHPEATLGIRSTYSSRLAQLRSFGVVIRQPSFSAWRIQCWTWTPLPSESLPSGSCHTRTRTPAIDAVSCPPCAPSRALHTRCH